MLWEKKIKREKKKRGEEDNGKKMHVAFSYEVKRRSLNIVHQTEVS